MVRLLWSQGVVEASNCRACLVEQAISLEQIVERKGAKAAAGTSEELASGTNREEMRLFFHLLIPVHELVRVDQDVAEIYKCDSVSNIQPFGKKSGQRQSLTRLLCDNGTVP